MARTLVDAILSRVELSKQRRMLARRQTAYSSQNKKRSFANHCIEALEQRNLMAAVPIANDDLAYFTNSGTDLVVSTSSNPGPVIANDVDIDLGSKTASVVANPTSGSLLSFGTNGTFTYRPNSGFVGVDSFTYKINDGTLNSNVATVRIAVGTRLLARQNLDSNVLTNTSAQTSVQPDVTSGGLQLSEQVTPDQTLVYRSNALSKPIIVVETKLAPGALPTALTAQLTFNGVAGTPFS